MSQTNRRKFLKYAGLALGGISLAGAGAAIFLRPKEASGVMPPYFKHMNEALKAAGMTRPAMILDLDRLDHNIAQTKSRFGDGLDYRISTKSLPSHSLLEYVQDKMGSQKMMGFHAPYLPQYAGYGDDVDILMGKPLLTGSVAEFLSQSSASDMRKIQWLADTLDRLQQLLELAEAQQTKLRISIELDIGLHRGGARSNDELGAMLARIRQHPAHFVLSGFMGYDGHVAAAPAPIATVKRSFDAAMSAYRRFKDLATNEFSDLMQGELTFNSGGSKTYRMFANDGMVNDIAAGSCMVKPSTFDMLDNHQPALFIAAPVLKMNDGLLIPFIEKAGSGLLSWWNPNTRQSFYLYGGGWAARVVAPEGVSETGLTADPPNQNLMPNQGLYNGPKDVELAEGDFVFMQPHQGDAISQFEEILVMRSGKVETTWKSFDRKY